VPIVLRCLVESYQNTLMKKIDFSVIIPTYNSGGFLRCALKSVFDQSYPVAEVLIIDNYSTDDTSSVIDEFADQRIRYFKIHNGGVIAKSRNIGIDNANSTWLAFLDSDDLWYPYRLESIYNRIESIKNIDVVTTDETLVDLGTGERKRIFHGPGNKDMYRSLLWNGNCLSPSATVVSRRFLDQRSLRFRENPRFITAEDYDFWLLLARHGAKFSFIRSVHGDYNVHAKNASKNQLLNIENSFNVIFDHTSNIEGLKSIPFIYRSSSRVRASFSEANISFLSGDFARAFSHLKVMASNLSLELIFLMTRRILNRVLMQVGLR